MKVKVFNGIIPAGLESALKQWLEKVNPVQVYAASQSQGRFEGGDFGVNLVVFYEHRRPLSDQVSDQV